MKGTKSTTEPFTLDPAVNTSGCSLQDRVPEIKLAHLTQLFGTPQRAGEDDPEKGYEWEYRFRNAEGAPITLYDRWSMWRIGAWSPEEAEEFKKWLLEKMK